MIPSVQKLIVLSLVYLVNCEDAAVKTAPTLNAAAKLVEEPNIEGRFGGYGGYARGNGYGYANIQPGPNQPNYGPQTFQPAVPNAPGQNYPIAGPGLSGLGPNSNGHNAYGGVTYGLDQGRPPIGSVGQNGFHPGGQFDPNYQRGVDGFYDYGPVDFDQYDHQVNHYGHHHHRHPYRHPGHDNGQGYGYYYKYGNNGNNGFGQDTQDGFEYGMDSLPQAFIRFGQLDNKPVDRYDYGAFGSYDDDHVSWTK